MQNKLQWLAMMSLVATGCAQQPTDPPGNEALGITEFRVSEAENLLTIVGVDAAKTTVGSVSLALGSFDDPDDGHLVPFGRTLSVDVKGFQMVHKSEGQPKLKLPVNAFGNEEAATLFLIDPHVANVLASHGVAFDVVARTDEQAYATCNVGSCTYGRSASCGTNQCAEYDYLGTTRESVCCAGSATAVSRECTGTGSDGCGTEGPNGCAVCWAYTYSSYCAIDSSDIWCALYFDGPNHTCRTGGQSCSQGVQCCSYPGDEVCVGGRCVYN